MPTLRCPRCKTVVSVAPGQAPACPSCGFGAVQAPPPPQPAAISPVAPATQPWALQDAAAPVPAAPAPAAPAPKAEPFHPSKVPLVLGIVGGIFGIFGGLFALAFGGFLDVAFGDSGGIVGLGWSAIAFSTLGIVGGTRSASKPNAAGWMLVVAAVGGLVSISFFFILPFILLLIGGFAAFADGRKARRHGRAVSAAA